jgi:DNA-binding SARP family transcriptional activator
MASFRILGALEVLTPEGLVTIEGRHHPRLLAMLLAEPNQVVPAERLATGLWDDRPPSTAARQVQNIAAALRRRLGALGDRLRKIGSGYRIDVAADELDLLRCERSEAAAREHREAGRLADAERALEDALAEWRGPSLAGLSGATLEREARRLDDYRLDLTEERIDLSLHLGRHEQYVNELRRLYTAHPHRPRLTELLMLALYRCGQATEALRVYAGFRSRLADELGTDPDRPLRDLHTAILREDPELDLDARAEPAAAGPETLPSGTTAFTGRSGHLAELDRSADSQSNPLVVLTGVGGVGKTMLALHWGHRSAHRFPGGRLYIDLRGFGPGGTVMEPAEAARHLLGAMGVEPRLIPADADAQLALYRGAIGGERRLLILDNVSDASQVRALLPGSPQVHTVAVSRRRLTGLAASHGAKIIAIGALDPAESAALLARQLGEERLASDPESAERILNACAGLPLALAIAGARAAIHPDRPLSAIAGELAVSRLDALAVDDDAVDVRAVFSWSHSSLEPEAARLFRLLALVPGPDFGDAAAARLHGGTAAEAGRALRSLVEAHLVERARPGRYRLHDLIRLYAAELVETEAPQPDRDAASDRLLDWYLNGADASRKALYPAMVALPLPETSGERTELTAEAAAQWFEDEWENLIAAVEHAAAHGRPRFAWLVADATRGYAWLHMLGDDGIRIGKAALAAATGAEDPLGQASAALALAAGMMRASQHDGAVEHFRDAADYARRAGWGPGEAAAEANLSMVCHRQGRMREGLAHAHAALRAFRAIGEQRSEAPTLHNLGLLHSLVGELDTGIDYLERSLKLTTESGSDSSRLLLLMHLTEIEVYRGRLDAAAAHLASAVELKRDSVSIARSDDLPGATARLMLAAGRTAEAVEHAERAVEILTEGADLRNRASDMVTLAAARDAAGEHREAVALCDRVLAMPDHNDTVFHRVEAMVRRAGAIFHDGNAVRARSAALQALRTTREADYRFLEGQALNLLADIDLADGRHSDATAKALEALDIGKETGHKPGEAESLRLLARIARADGDAETHRRRRDEARALCAEIGTAVPDDLALPDPAAVLPVNRLAIRLPRRQDGLGGGARRRRPAGPYRRSTR